MSDVREAFEWFYIGHYGQLGPLSADQMSDLIRDGVIERETYVWRPGMADWVRAKNISDFDVLLTKFQPGAPPPPPIAPSAMPPTPQSTMTANPTAPPFAEFPTAQAPLAQNYVPVYPTTGSPYDAYPVSDKSKVVAGVLQIIFPGLGRMYMGYLAHGFIQFILTFCLFLGYVWSVLDGVLILSGAVKLDGHGRRLRD